MNALSNPLNPVTTSDRQPSAWERMSAFKADWYKDPERCQPMGNPFQKQFNQEQRNDRV